MAGHSKWANIKHRKAGQDAKRSKLFGRLIREIAVAARSGDQVDANPRLRLAVDKAQAANLNKDTIQRAIQRGSGGGDAGDIQECSYEGYAPGGVAVLVEAMTDNRNRTVAEVRHAFSRFGGNLGADGSVAYLFRRCAQVLVERDAAPDADALLEVALEAGAEDVQEEPGGWVLQAGTGQLAAMVEALRAAGVEAAESELAWIPETLVQVPADKAESVQKMLDMLDELDDVQAVHTNADFGADPDADRDDGGEPGAGG